MKMFSERGIPGSKHIPKTNPESTIRPHNLLVQLHIPPRTGAYEQRIVRSVCLIKYQHGSGIHISLWVIFFVFFQAILAERQIAADCGIPYGYLSHPTRPEKIFRRNGWKCFIRYDVETDANTVGSRRHRHCCLVAVVPKRIARDHEA